MSLRLSGLRRGFRHGGLVLGDRWTAFGALTDEQRATLRDFHGSHVRIHPSDVGELADLGLEMKVDETGNRLTREPLVDLRSQPRKKTPEPAKAKTDARKD